MRGFGLLWPAASELTACDIAAGEFLQTRLNEDHTYHMDRGKSELVQLKHFDAAVSFERMAEDLRSKQEARA